MNQKNFSFNYFETEDYRSLDPADQDLVIRAFNAAGKAFSPYSQFKVGAALRLDNGVIITGNNQENAAYPSGLCAERVAMFYASSQYPGHAVETLAVVAYTDLARLDSVVPPCGACRQVLAEYQHLGNNKIRIIMASANGKALILEGVETLLPFSFHADYLKKAKH